MFSSPTPSPSSRGRRPSRHSARSTESRSTPRRRNSPESKLAALIPPPRPTTKKTVLPLYVVAPFSLTRTVGVVSIKIPPFGATDASPETTCWEFENTFFSVYTWNRFGVWRRFFASTYSVKRSAPRGRKSVARGFVWSRTKIVINAYVKNRTFRKFTRTYIESVWTFADPGLAGGQRTTSSDNAV